MAHMDLKIDNIVISDNLMPAIIDWETALFTEDELSQDYDKGTSSYQPPEVRDRASFPFGFYPKKVDIFNLGIVLFTLTFNSVPF